MSENTLQDVINAFINQAGQFETESVTSHQSEFKAMFEAVIELKDATLPDKLRCAKALDTAKHQHADNTRQYKQLGKLQAFLYQELDASLAQLVDDMVDPDVLAKPLAVSSPRRSL